MTKNLAIGVIVVSLFVIPITTSVAHAQYLGNVGESGKTGSGTLEAALKAAHDKVVYAERFPSSGSGTPYFAADGVIGASLISAGVFGGIAASLFIRARHGKYAAPGLG